jgi:murein DD-endopeptidase MepM/ murein hydrolase activator NlpD
MLARLSLPSMTASRSGSVFDHDLPFEFADTNGYLVSFWGEKLSGIDGHNGYDFLVAEGTPVHAAGPGTVSFAGGETPFFCPLLNAT